MLGQRVPARLVKLVEDRSVWEQRKNMILMMRLASLPQAEALQVMMERPEMIEQIVNDEGSTVALSHARMRTPAGFRTWG